MAHTPWGELRIDDAHIHFFSHGFYSALAGQRKLESAEALGPLLEWEIPTVEPAALAERWVHELDANRVSRACLIASSPGDEDSVALAVASHPDRFFGYFMLDPLRPDARERMERAAASPHLHCVCLFPAMHRYSITDAQVTPVLEIASAHQHAVFVHCGTLTASTATSICGCRIRSTCTPWRCASRRSGSSSLTSARAFSGRR
jgi:predicted TIM-barrel fold metal-dependent hydrolase